MLGGAVYLIHCGFAAESNIKPTEVKDDGSGITENGVSYSETLSATGARKVSIQTSIHPQA